MKEKEREPVVFGALDLEADIAISHRNLPHWYQVGAAVFVTFRAADSLPKEVLERMASELRNWLGRHRLPLELADSIHRGKLSDYFQWLDLLNPSQRSEFRRLSDRLFHQSLDDCHGACLLKNASIAQIVADAILKFDQQRYDLDSFVIMPNHVHAIVQFRPGYQLDTISQSWMRYTARCINTELSRSGVFWQPEPFDHIIRSSEQFSYLHRYIAENPDKARLQPGEYIYWSREIV